MNNIDRILREYNPEYDVPPGPRVPWYTVILAAKVKEQDREIDELRFALAHLTDVLEASVNNQKKLTNLIRKIVEIP